MNFKAIQEQIEQGYIKALPKGDLTLYNYTERAQFNSVWTPETLACRGLVACGDKVVARPFRKFFNLHEHKGAIPAETPELATKHDGSLIIVFHDGENWRAVTRGSWLNPQIEAAQKWLAANADKLAPEFTWLFELVAPWNRIVVSYPDERMVLIGVVDTQTGEEMSYARLSGEAERRGLESVDFIEQPLESVDLKEPFNNREGYVARFSTGLRLKIKFDDYKRIHAILSSASTDFVVEALAAGKRERLEGAPDEFYAWLLEEEKRVLAMHGALMAEAREWASKTSSLLTQKDKALVILQAREEIRPIAFGIINNKSPEAIAWKRLADMIDKRLWRPAGMVVGEAG